MFMSDVALRIKFMFLHPMRLEGLGPRRAGAGAGGGAEGVGGSNDDDEACIVDETKGVGGVGAGATERNEDVNVDQL